MVEISMKLFNIKMEKTEDEGNTEQETLKLMRRKVHVDVNGIPISMR